MLGAMLRAGGDDVLRCRSSGLAQVAPYGEKSMGDPAQDHLPDILNTVKITQRLGQQLPLDAPVSRRDGQGRSSWETTSARIP